jgi:periplasmic divalent cation tolerance protein
MIGKQGMIKITNYIVIFTTCANKKQADTIARELVKSKLAACVNIVGNIKSVFWWQAKLDKTNEVLLIIKSKKSKFDKIAKLVRAIHSYEVPEIISLPITAGNKDYLEWLDANIR